jgi:hypothetical protein
MQKIARIAAIGGDSRVCARVQPVQFDYDPV